MKRIRTYAATFLILSFSASAPAATMLGCMRSFQLHPEASKDEKGHADVYLPAVRRGKTGFYLFSGDDSGKSPIFIPLTSEEAKDGDFDLQFVHPITKRLISLSGAGLDPKRPLSVSIRSEKADQSKQRLVKDIEITQDTPAAEALDKAVALLASAQTDMVTNSSVGLGLIFPNTYPNAPKIGMNEPKVLKLYQEKKREAAARIADAYVKSVPDMLKINNELISRYRALLKENCLDVGIDAKVAVKSSLEKLDIITKLNAALPKQISDGISATLPKALEDAKDKSFSKPELLRAFIAGHIQQRVSDIRAEAANKKNLSDAPPHSTSEGQSSEDGESTH